MRFSYNVYPEAMKKLEDSGLIKKIKEAHKKDKICIDGAVYDDMVVDYIKCMRERKLFDVIPADERKEFMRRLNDAWIARNDDKKGWVVKKKGTEHIEGAEPEDFLGMVGWEASRFMPKEDIFNWRKYGFSSLTDFTGCIGAAISLELHDGGRSFRGGYEWESKSLDGRILLNQISGSEHGDLRVFQTDLTPYETIDPIGNKVSYRPEIDGDMGVVSAYHSTEPELLVAVLKWIDQFEINCDALKDKAGKTIEWAGTLRRGNILFADHGDRDRHPRMYFIGYNNSMAVLDESDCSNDMSRNILCTEGGGVYGIYARTKTKELAFTYQNIAGGRKVKRDISVAFQPSDAGHLIKGLLYQSAKALGRTSAAQLVDMLRYKFSDDFTKDLERMKKGTV